MGSLSDIVINAIFQLWHLIPIVIVIIVFKKFIDKKDKKLKIKKNEENKKNGLTLELRTVKNYEDLGYKVASKEVQDSENDYGIDLFCYRENKTLLIQCKDISKSKSITEEDIRTFYSNAIKYIKSNNIEEKDVEFRFIVPYKDVLDKSAIKILSDNFYNCKYAII
jgi:hypothetical protein